MKKCYEKPIASRVDFSYEEQIVAESGAGEGNQKNPGNGDTVCRWATYRCNEMQG